MEAVINKLIPNNASRKTEVRTKDWEACNWAMRKKKKRFRVVDFSFHLKNLVLVTITRLTIGAWLLVFFWTLQSWKFDPCFKSEFTFRSKKPRASKYMSSQAQNSLRLKYLALWHTTDLTMEGKCTRCYQPIKAHLDTLSIKRADWNKRVRRQFSYSDTTGITRPGR